MKLFFFRYYWLIGFILIACQEEDNKVLTPLPSFEPYSMPASGDVFDLSYIQALTKSVANWQINHPIDMPEDTDWARSTFMLGVVSAYRVTQNKDYLTYVHNWAEQNQWGLSNHSHPANNLLCAKAYLELTELRKNAINTQFIEKEIQRIRKANIPGREEWHWCDAFFMAPPTIVHFHKLLDTDNNYSQFYTMWWDAHDHLYSPQDSLYYRDERFIGSRTFWLRGNGWVLAGIAKILEQLSPEEQEYTRLSKVFTEMAVKFRNMQNEEGLWHPSVLNSHKHLLSEASGSALITYALAWGVNNSVLNKQAFDECIRHAWLGITSKIYDSGKVGWVQPRGEKPMNIRADDFQEYGAGSVLLAADEIYQYIDNE
ncbi:glycoside hydrolase family 88 protein [Tunicatimonas pelagia]|uniref:glycoside hydrolase family 88 protein n=1 Tax=Tunicatimonas pelagia TaxID=931531 RepID=UPI0026658111|nr:glycoside hydrolase family 88 protein [Tunicatimonas pelagia]WKN40708.1 glycoside hydrolase family 88 protein [Tunicatimonas pelagia]